MRLRHRCFLVNFAIFHEKAPLWNVRLGSKYTLASLQYATHANHASTPPILPTLAHHPCHPRWHVTLARCQRNPRQHATNAKHHPCQHASRATTPPTTLTVAQIANHFSIFSSFQVSNSKRKFSSFCFYFLLYNLYFEVKLFQRTLVCLIQRTTIFSKTNAQLFLKNLFPSVVLTNLLYNSLLKINYLYHQF